MARPLRIEFPGAVYHVTSRGNARQHIFLDDEDRRLFLSVLEQVVSRFHLVLHAYCLMDNHYHLMVETPEANLSKALRHLNGVYTQAFNRRHGRVGHVVQGRFKSILVDRDSYLLELCRYVVLNPVRAGMVKKPHNYRWSSYRATAGLDARTGFLTIDWLLSQFGKQRASAQRRYERFVADGMKSASPWDKVQGQVLLGDEAFVERLQPGLKDKQHLREIPRQQRFAARPALGKLFTASVVKDRARRNALIRQAHLDHAYTLAEIGKAVQLHYATVSRIVTGQLSEDGKHSALRTPHDSQSRLMAERRKRHGRPRCIIIAGPNGAGKTTFAREYLPHDAGIIHFVNADLIASGLSPLKPELAALAAGRVFLKELDRLAAAGTSFAFESTLSGTTYAGRLRQWKTVGYRIEIVFLKVRSPRLALRRIAARVRQGGHDVPKADVLRRFARGWANFQAVYRPLADVWTVYDNSSDTPILLERGP